LQAASGLNIDVPESRRVDVYAVGTLFGLGFNLMTLFLSTFYLLVLSVVPKGGVRL